MKKVIFALVLGLSVSGIALAGGGGRCSGSNCKTETPVVPSLKDAKMVAEGGCEDGGCWLHEETPVVPSLKDAKVVANGGGCMGCDDDSKAQTLTPAQMKNLVAGDDGEGGGGCSGCDLYEETPVVPSLKDAKMVAGTTTCGDCGDKAQTPTHAQMKNLVADGDDEGGGGGADLYEETPVPSLKDAKMVAGDGGMCGGCDDDSDSKAQTLTPAQMKNLVADGDGDDFGGCGGCLYQPSVLAKQA